MSSRQYFLMAVGALAVAATSAEAGSLTFKIEVPGVETSQVAGSTIVQDFDSLSNPFPTGGSQALNVGTYSATEAVPVVFGADVFGGAGGTGNYLELEATTETVILDFTQGNLNATDGVGYFGFWWSAGDGQNRLTVNMKDGSSQVFTTQSILDSPNLQGTPQGLTGLPDGHYGNRNGPFNSTDYNSDEVYAFVNIFADDDDSRILSVVIETSGDSGFETDNHTVIVDLIDDGNQTGEEIEQPDLAGMNLTAECAVGDTRYWRVTNDETLNIPFSWDGPGANDGTGTALANDRTYFTTIDAGEPNTTTISWINPGGTKNQVTKAHNNAPCVYRVSFDKQWNGAGAPDLDGATLLNAESSLGTATCTSDDGALSCVYSTGDDLHVPFGETYTVNETAVAGWSVADGVGSGFTGIEGIDQDALPDDLVYQVADDRYCVTDPTSDSPFKEIFCTHTVINELRSGGGGGPEPIPAVGPLGACLLASLLAGVGVFRLRRRQG